MVKNAIYWAGRHEQWFKNQDKLDEAVSKRLEKEYKRTAKELEVAIASYFMRYGVDNVIEFRTMMQQLDKADRDLLFQDMDSFALKYPEYAHLLPVRESIYQLNRLEGLHYSTQMKLLELGVIEHQQLEKHLEATYGKRYKEMLEELGIGHSFLAINNEVMKSTLYARWVNAQNFSDRIWDNKQRLLDQLRTRYRDGLARGDNYEKLIKEIRKRMDVGYKDARRLVWTEAAFVLNQAHTHAYQNAGVEEYKISAILDNKTSPICRDMDGEVFRFEDMKVGTNFPPFHPYCRTTFIGILKEQETGKFLNDRSGDNDDKSGILSDNKWLLAGFASQKKYDKHVEKHLYEYGDILPEEYLGIAQELLAAPLNDDVEGFVTEDGFIFKYRHSTNDFVIGRPDGHISTLFKPVDGREYWEEEKRKRGH